ncbi:Meiosis specific protein SPO22 [Penicillium sp. IBT 31633x]|nr:Meiosis specific protein SPO22 [Penicillium sp. IBT 31633x]
MAQPARPARTLTELAYLLQTTLSTPRALTQPLLTSDIILLLDAELNRNPFNYVNNGAGISRLDMVGTLLWNTCTELSLSRTGNPNDLRTLAKVRALAFAVLNRAVPSDLLGSLRALDLALNSARICLVDSQLDVTLNILSTAAQRLTDVQPSHLGLDPGINRTLTTRYYLLRVRLAWLQGRVDIAEHFFSKVPWPFLSQDRECIFDTCFIIGDSALALRQSEVAMNWLQRACDHLQALAVATEMKYPFFSDWNLVVRHSLAAACTQLKTPQSLATRAGEMAILREIYPEHPAVVLFDLSIGHNSPSVNQSLEGKAGFHVGYNFSNPLVVGLKRLVEKTQLTDSNMPIIFQFARSLGQTGGVDDGMEALRILLMGTLPSGEWREKCFVGFVLLLSRSLSLDSGSDCSRTSTLRNLIDALEYRGLPSFRASAAQATIICIWKITGAAILKHDYWTAEQWLLICSDPKIFQNCSLSVQIAIQKNLMACYLHTGSINAARELMNRGLVQVQMDCQRMYLSYKLILLEGKDASGFFCLGFPPEPVPQKQMSLLSCAIEAQRQHKPEQVLDCLDQFIKCLTSDDIYHEDFSAAEHYMFAVVLLYEELSKGFNQRLGKFIETVLESALSYAKENSMFEGGSQEVSVTQLQWLYFATYKIALKLIKSSGFQWTESVLNYSKEFALQYRRTAYPEIGSKAPRPHLFAVSYLSILVSSLEARCEVDPANKELHYQKVRSSFNELADLFGWNDGEEESDHAENVKEDRHHDIAQFYDLEAAMHLKQWDDVTNICESDDAFPDLNFYAPIMDLTLQLDLPPALAIKVIKRIVFKLYELQDISRFPATTWPRDLRVCLPRYLHCLFMLAIAPAPYSTTVPEFAPFDVEMVDAGVAEEVLDQVIVMAEYGANLETEGQVDQNDLFAQPDSELYPFRGNFTYPSAELTKIASVAFNTATDFYRATKDEDCQRWANKAIRVARCVPGYIRYFVAREVYGEPER